MDLEQQLKKEGFKHIFLWHDEPGVTYPEHAHKDRVSFFVTRGWVQFSGDIKEKVVTGQRFDVPPGVKHSAVVSPEGCDWVVGEMIEGDA